MRFVCCLSSCIYFRPAACDDGSQGADNLSAQNVSHLCMLAHLALLLKRVIADVNVHSANNFKLRIGEYSYIFYYIFRKPC